jgi:esterase/lipase superfamily enzyme
MCYRRRDLFFSTTIFGLMLGGLAHGARILNVHVESKTDEKKQDVVVELLFDPGEAAVKLEVYAFDFNDQVIPSLRPILSNNPSAKAASGQYAAKTTVVQEKRQRVQKHTFTVILDHLRLNPGMHQIIYQVCVLQDGKSVELVSAPKSMISVGKAAKVTGQRTANVEVTEVKPQQKTIDVERVVNGEKVTERATIIIREPVSKRVQQQVPTIDSGEYSEVFAFAPPPEVNVDDPNIAAQMEDTQTSPWTPPRTIRINFATNRNVVKPSAQDATRFGSDVGPLNFGTALGDISVKKTHGERLPSQEPVRPTPQDSFKVSQITRLSEDDFFQAISNALWQTVGEGPTTKNDVIVFIHGYNNSFRFSCVRFAQLVYDTRFEGKPVLFSWPSNGGDSLLEEAGGFLSYGSDRADAKSSVDSLADVLRQIALDERKPQNAATKRGDIHLVAHSMGCQLLVDALEKLQNGWMAGQRPFKSIILAAPDVDSDDLSRFQCVRTPAERVTLYYCEADRALWASSQFHARQPGGVLRHRVGQALCILPEIENIDANKANTTFIGHSYFVDGSLVLRDLEDIVQRNYGPELRVLCPDSKQPEKYAFWRIIDDKTQCESPATQPLAPSAHPSPSKKRSRNSAQ